MNEAVPKIWAEVGAERDETARGFGELTEERALESESYLRAVTPLLRWLGVGYSAGHRRPGAAFYETLLGRGQAACEAVLNRYLEEAPDPRAEALPLWRALSGAVRIAHNRGFVSWDLDRWKPMGGDDSKARLVGYVAPEIGERTRRLAFESRQSLSAVIESALAERIEKHEKKHGPLVPREPVTATA